MPATITDVAARARVSTATVSVVLNNVDGARVAPSTRQRVLEAAAELGYSPNSLARGLRIQRTHTIGVVSDQVITTPYATLMILGVQDVARAAGFMPILLNTDGDPDNEREAIEALLERRVEGLIYESMYHREVSPPRDLRRVPAVVLDASVPDGSLPYVVPDDEQGGYDATRLLIDHGHRRIVHLSAAEDIPATRLRCVGFRRALVEAGFDVEPHIVPVSSPPVENGERTAADLLSQPDRPTAIFAFNDRVAAGAFRAARKLGLAIPGDVSIVGYDDLAVLADALDPPLTTVALPHRAMGHWAARRLLDLIQHADPASDAESMRLEPCPIVVRGSVGPPPGERR